MPTATVRYFAMLREHKGVSSETVEYPDGATVGELFQQVFPGHAKTGMSVGFAINLTQVAQDAPVQDGDEVAFLPPLGGG